MHQMSSGIHARESEIAMRDLLKSATHVVAMDAFANESTLTFLKQYRGKDVRIFDNKYQPRKNEFVKILYDLNKGSEANVKILQARGLFYDSCKKVLALALQITETRRFFYFSTCLFWSNGW